MQALNTFLRQATDSGTVPGAVVVAARGQVVWHQAYGAAALPQNTALCSATRSSTSPR